MSLDFLASEVMFTVEIFAKVELKCLSKNTKEFSGYKRV